MDANSLIYTMLPWVVGATGAFFVLFIFLKIWRSVVARKVNSIGLTTGMAMGDTDQMRKRGLISEEEYRVIRGTLARREVSQTREADRIARERDLITQIEKQPDLARQLISPEKLQQARDRQAAFAERQNAAAGPGADAAPRPPAAPNARPATKGRPAPARTAARSAMGGANGGADLGGDPLDWEALADPLSVLGAGARPLALHAASAAHRKAANSGGGNPRDIDILLAKGAITRAEYDRLKQFFE